MVSVCGRSAGPCGARALEKARAQGRLRLRPIHGDPKVNNVMLDTATGQAVGMVDLDTVKPGLVHYDIGDCLRSGCNPLGEETEDWEAVRFEPELCRAILAGYLSLARDFLTETDYAYLYDAIRLLAFELGLRFFTDYLAGNVYFKARHPEHNLVRALVQFKLTESIESQAAAIRRHHPGPADEPPELFPGAISPRRPPALFARSPAASPGAPINWPSAMISGAIWRSW